jgi:hypothetical protein
MRVGFNPRKDKEQEPNDFFHQVIIPVYIPSNKGYFKDSFQILKYCVESLLKTIQPKTFVTLVDNGSCTDVVDYLNELYQSEKIHEIIHTTNIGKLNAILKGISGHDFSFITVADCDVLFLNNWQSETYLVFEKFPKTGAVCPTPSSKSLKSYTFNIWSELLLSRELRFTKVKNPSALLAFAKSVGNPDMYNKQHLDKYLTVTKGNFRAVVGAGHFVTTYRKEVFENVINMHSNFALGGDSESKLLDLPVVKKGMWRLSTEDNFAYHMGNVEEKWMNETCEAIALNDFYPQRPIILESIQFSKLGYFFKYRLFSKIITRKIIWHYCLILKGLTKNEAAEYINKK